MSQSMAWEDASEAKISNNFSTIQLIKTYFIENVCMPCRQKTRKTEAKLSNFFFCYQTNRIFTSATRRGNGPAIINAKVVDNRIAYNYCLQFQIAFRIFKDKFYGTSFLRLF